jgi:hypothetical protein
MLSSPMPWDTCETLCWWCLLFRPTHCLRVANAWYMTALAATTDRVIYFRRDSIVAALLSEGLETGSDHRTNCRPATIMGRSGYTTAWCMIAKTGQH